MSEFLYSPTEPIYVGQFPEDRVQPIDAGDGATVTPEIAINVARRRLRTLAEQPSGRTPWAAIGIGLIVGLLINRRGKR